MTNRRYAHTQSAPLARLLGLLAAVTASFAWLVRDATWIGATLGFAALLILLVACSFARLTVQDEGDFLGIRYGPLPLFYRRIAFDEIAEAQRGRTQWIDGWGIHWVPGRGWTYNLWGFDCVRLDVAGTTIRVGTDDPQGLLAMIQEKIADPERGPQPGQP